MISAIISRSCGERSGTTAGDDNDDDDEGDDDDANESWGAFGKCVLDVPPKFDDDDKRLV